MDLGYFFSRLNAFQERFESIIRSHGEVDDDQQLDLAQELQTLFEELHVTTEMLQEKNKELLAAQEEIIYEQQRFRNLFEMAPDAFLVTDLNGKILEANYAAEKLLKVPHGYLINKPLAVFIALEDRQKFRKQLISLFSNSEESVDHVRDWDFRIHARNETNLIDVNITVAKALEKSGDQQMINLLWMVRDITLRKNAQRELEQARQELEQRVVERTAELTMTNYQLESTTKELELKNRDLQDFALIASHDLKEPLRKIQSFTMLAQNHPAQDELIDYLSRMASAAVRMQNLLDALLEYSRVGTRGGPFSEVDLNLVVPQVIDDIDYRLVESGGQVVFEALPTVYGDPSQVRQLLQNLLVNGLKFHRPGVPPIVQIRGQAQDDEVSVEVIDNGIGFDMEYAERIFQPFQRLHGRNEYHGTGMGLAISRRIMERHGGRITVDSVSGEGTTFTICFPNK